MVSRVRLGDGAGGTVTDHHGVEIAKSGGRQLPVGETWASGLDAHHRRRRTAVSAEKYQIEMNGIALVTEAWLGEICYLNYATISKPVSESSSIHFFGFCPRV